MAFTFLVNQQPIDGTDGVFKFLTTAVSAGWTVINSADGITFPHAITQSRLSTGGLQNPRAWFVIQQPGAVHRQLCIQRSADGVFTNNNFRVKYSPAAGFTGGAPSATQTPSATDEQIILGSGTDASPNFNQFVSNETQTRWHMAFGDTTVGFGFWAVAYLWGTNQAQMGFMIDVMQPGTFPVADTDPSIIYHSAGVVNAFGVDLRSGSGFGFLGSITTVAFVPIEAMALHSTNGVGFPSVVGSNAWTGKEDIVPVAFVRGNALGAPFGFKGFSSMLTWIATPRNSTDLITVSSNKDHLVAGSPQSSMLLPWPSGTDIVI